MQTALFKVRLGDQTVGVSYSSSGAGSTILLLHGWAHTNTIWHKVMSLLSSNRRRIVAIDWPGFGSSPAPPASLQNISSYSMMLAKLLEQLEITTEIQAIVADSLGARILYDLLNNGYRGKCSRFLMSGCPFDGLPFLLNVFQLLRLPSVLISAVQMLPTEVGRTAIDMFAWYTIRRRSGNMEPIYDGIIRCDPCASERLLRALCARADPPLPERFSTLRVGLLRGQHDRLMSERTQKHWARCLRATSIEVRSVGHTPMVEASDDYAAAINRLLL